MATFTTWSDAIKATAAHLGSKINERAKRSSLPVNVRDFGATGDGTTDDLASVVAALAATPTGGTLYVPAGRYLLSDTLTVSRAVTIGGPGVLLGGKVDVPVVALPADGAALEGVTIDGGAKARIGVLVTGAGCRVVGSQVGNVRSATQAAHGVSVVTSGGVTVRGNRIDLVESVGNTTAGDNNGASRGIYLWVATDATAPSVIADNIVTRVIGEEGDAIQITGASALAEVRGNHISGWSKRAVKVQASDVQVLDNVIPESSGAVAAGAVVDVLGPLSDVLVARNAIRSAGKMLVQVSAATGVRVSDNRLVAGSLAAVAVVGAIDVTVDGNDIEKGSAAVAVTGGSAHVVVARNVARGDATGTNAFSSTADCDDVAFLGNRGYGTGRTWLVSVASSNSAAIDNDAQFDNTNSGGVRLSTSGIGARARGNVSKYGSAVYSTDYTAQRVAVEPWSSADVPSVEQPTTRHNRGDIAFNRAPVAGGTAGWVCVASGTPGTWKPFGVISA